MTKPMAATPAAVKMRGVLRRGIIVRSRVASRLRLLVLGPRQRDGSSPQQGLSKERQAYGPLADVRQGAPQTRAPRVTIHHWRCLASSPSSPEREPGLVSEV
jgi:hypothetical protein